MRTPRLSTLLLLCLLTILPFQTALAAPGPDDDRATPLALPRLSGPITLDGLSDEAAWQAIEPLPLTMFEPIFEGAMTERTEIRVAYDDDYLYVAGRLYDSEPHRIQAVDLVRDASSLQNDWLGIILDSFNDNENALTFWTNPAGTRFDFSVSNDVTGNNWYNSSGTPSGTWPPSRMRRDGSPRYAFPSPVCAFRMRTERSSWDLPSPA